MRVVLIGPAVDRARLRSDLAKTNVIVVAEAETTADAHALGTDADAYLLSASAGASRSIGDNEFHEPLTPRELEVLTLLAEGLSNKGIAERLAISDQTVKFHVAAIYGKLGAANRADAVRRAARRGLITL